MFANRQMEKVGAINNSHATSSKFSIFPKKRGGRKKGSRNKRSASGSLNPTIQQKKGKFYPRVEVDEQERRARLHDNPYSKPDWFVWLYNWAVQDETGRWKNRSKRVPIALIMRVRSAIAKGEPVVKILNLIDS